MLVLAPFGECVQHIYRQPVSSVVMEECVGDGLCGVQTPALTTCGARLAIRRPRHLLQLNPQLETTNRNIRIPSTISLPLPTTLLHY